MVTGNSIKLEQAKSVPDVIKYFYDVETDEFFFHLHERQGTKEQCIASSIEAIGLHGEVILVYVKDDLAAFFVRYQQGGELAMPGFHVMKNYRNREFLTLFWQKVKSYFGSTFKAGVYCKNEPAHRTLIEAGFSVHRHHLTYEKQVFIIYKSN